MADGIRGRCSWLGLNLALPILFAFFPFLEALFLLLCLFNMQAPSYDDPSSPHLYGPDGWQALLNKLRGQGQ